MTTPSDGDRFDVAVVGLGLVGAAALRHLTAAGLRCAGVGPSEPTELSTHQGVFASHYDSGRITRRLDKRAEWALLAERAIDAYAAIERASGITFHHPVGVLFADIDADRLAAVIAVAHYLDIGFDKYEPGMPFGDERIVVPSAATVLREPAPGGFIDPRKMLAAQLIVARQQGAEVRDVAVDGVEHLPGGGWLVRTAAGEALEAEQVVIAAGPHADELAGTPQPLIDVVAETVVLARVSAAEQERLAELPSIIVDGADDHLYIVPPTDYPDGHVYVKLGATRHDRWALLPEERREWMTGTAHLHDLDWLRSLLLGVLPGLQVEAWATKPCLIPDTPTKLPYLEITDQGLVMAVGGNGYAAKSADAIGALAAGLVMEGAWTDADLDAASFRLITRS